MVTSTQPTRQSLSGHSAPLVKLDFQKRLIRLTPNSAQQVVLIGDFADQKDVVLDPSYVNFTSTTSSVASIFATGRLQALFQRIDDFGCIVTRLSSRHIGDSWRTSRCSNQLTLHQRIRHVSAGGNR